LQKLKKSRDELKAAEDAKANLPKFNREALDSLLTRRFFFAQSFKIYGGVAGLYDYGPVGSALMNNFLDIWRKHFVLEEDMLEIECTNITPESVFKTSGHVERFADWMCKDVKTGQPLRQDHVVKQVLKERLEDHEKLVRAGKDAEKEKKRLKLKGSILSAETKKEYEDLLEALDNYTGPELYQLMVKYEIKSPETGNDLSEPQMFNLMFDTQIGPTGQFKGFLRPETAQGHFLNFNKLLEFNNGRMPFASASVGKSFRNEIAPRAGLMRVREFTMAEIEHYVDPLNKKHVRFSEVANIELPLYSADNQLSGGGIFRMTVGEAVSKGIINNETLGYFMARIWLFLLRIGCDKTRVRFRQHMQNEMAHYACDCWDAEIENSTGWTECVGCADRSAYDLTAHSKATGEKLVVREPLPEPITRDILVVEIGDKAISSTFKGDTGKVRAWINTLKGTETAWDQDRAETLKKELENGGGKTEITTYDGFKFTLTNAMLKVVQKSEKISIREFTPNVIEPSFGIGRILTALIEHVYWSRDEQRVVLSFPPVIAPYKCLVLPISNNADFQPHIRKAVTELRKLGLSNRVDDSAPSIGKRYSRNDELGTPFGITIDFETLRDGTVTLRERDSMKQIRGSVSDIVGVIKDVVDEKTTWDEATKRFPSFSAGEE
ncbi:hypothetical protein BJ742DRAFT_790349, partial [Cladochytrium replicatum]